MLQFRQFLNTILIVVALGGLSPQLTRTAWAAQSATTQSEHWLGKQSHKPELRPTNVIQVAEADPRKTEADRLVSEGSEQYKRNEWRTALATWQQALVIYQDIGDRTSEGRTLNKIGLVYRLLGNYPEALDYYSQSLLIAQEIVDRTTEAGVLNNIGLVNFSLSNYPEALKYYAQSLAIKRELGDRLGEARTLNNIGLVNDVQGNYPEALKYYAQSLVIKRELGDRFGEGRTLKNIGAVNDAQGNYPGALDYYTQSLIIAQDIGDRVAEAQILNNIGEVNHSLGNNPEALDYYAKSLLIAQEIGARAAEAVALNNIGLVNNSLKNYPEALDYYNQSLLIVETINDRLRVAKVLNNIGIANHALGNYSEALNNYDQSLLITKEIGDRATEAKILNNIGAVNRLSGNYPEALDYYVQSLAISRNLGERVSEAGTLTSMGLLFQQQSQPDLAIVFLKEAVNVYEKIRTNHRQLSLEDQQLYIVTIASRYRILAALLLNQGRIPEAQQVLDLLQLEELREFTDIRAVWTSNGIRLSESEQTVVDAYGSLVALGGKLVECERNNCDALDSLYDQQESLLAQYDSEVERFVEAVRINRRNDALFQNPDNISGDAQDLLEAYAADEQNALIVYPFVLEDKLWLVWVTIGDVVGSIEVPVPQGELATTVQQFGALLKSRSSDIDALQATSQQLYSWIIQPLAAELEKNDIDHLVFVNDRVTRYIPMGALYDGENYLLERYAVSTVLAPGATEMGDRIGSATESTVLGLGLTEAVENFNPLPAVRDELAGIIKGQDGKGVYLGHALLNQDFTFDALKNNVQGNRILHVATHAAFEPGRPEESFIVLGDGNRMKIPDIETMQRRLRDLHLVVLSACQTALGGINQEDGSEITGLSSYFLETNRAEAVVASLWAVNDTSTSILMQRFYQNLAAGETKADALRNAQLSLLGSTQSVDGRDRIIGQRQAEPQGTTALSHPYYWAPFILIGNGL